MYLGVGTSPAELLGPRRSAARDRGRGEEPEEAEEAEEAKGAPPVVVNSAYNNVVGLSGSVSPGHFAQFQRTAPQLVLADTKLAYQSVKRRRLEKGASSCLPCTSHAPSGRTVWR